MKHYIDYWKNSQLLQPTFKLDQITATESFLLDCVKFKEIESNDRYKKGFVGTFTFDVTEYLDADEFEQPAMRELLKEDIFISIITELESLLEKRRKNE